MNKNTLYIGLAALIIIAGGAYLVFANRAPVSETVTNQMPVTSGENGGGIHDLPVEPAAAAARTDLAAELSVAEGSIVIMNIEEKTWSDGCLGLAGADEFCTQAMVDGFRVEMLAQGQTYFYRTDKTGTSLRQEI